MEFKKNTENQHFSNNEYQGKPTKSKILLGILFFVVCMLLSVWYMIHLWHNFIAFEDNTKDIELPSIIYLLYQIGGKYLALSAPIVIIGCCFWIISKGVQRILKKDYEN